MLPEQIWSLFTDGFIEFNGIGFNSGTIGFIGAMVLAILGGIGQYHQLQKICSGQSGEGVSVLWTLSFSAMFSGILLYGIEKATLALIFTCLVRICLYVPILWNLRRYNGGFTKAQLFLGVAYAAALVVMGTQADRSGMFIAFNWVGIITTLSQPWKMIRDRAVGVFSVRMLCMYSLSVVFWLIYDSYFHVPMLSVMMWCLGGAYALTFVTWMVYRKRPVTLVA